MRWVWIVIGIIFISGAFLWWKSQWTEVPQYNQNSSSSVSQVDRPAKKKPVRNWDILDPEVKAEAALVYSLDDNLAFYSYRTYKQWPIASITKLLTAAVSLDTFGPNAKVAISDKAITTEGNSGDLKSGEVYPLRDLVKILLLSSSNDAAVAIEEFAGGREKFIPDLNKRAEALGMSQTSIEEPSGLSPKNISSATDLLALTRFVVEREPEIFSWTRLENLLVQPLNSSDSRIVQNINPLILESDFLGGKTGTTPEARQNLVAVFSFEKRRVAVVILGSPDRLGETRKLLDWVRRAYELQ
jgi:D-alanyl-D-alanine carboxypeptidase